VFRLGSNVSNGLAELDPGRFACTNTAVPLDAYCRGTRMYAIAASTSDKSKPAAVMCHLTSRTRTKLPEVIELKSFRHSTWSALIAR